MKGRLLSSGVSALGVTTIWCLSMVGSLVSQSHNEIYHWSGPPSSLFFPVLLDFLCLWLLLTLLLLSAKRTGRRAVAVWAGITFLLPWAILKNVALLNHRIMPHWVSRGVFGLSVVALVLVAGRWRPAHKDVFEEVQRFAVTVLYFVAVLGLVLLTQLIWFGWRARSLNADFPLHSVSGVARSRKVDHPRIVWIVLDELSYQQVYGKRFHGLKLPAFDQLATEATVFTHVVPGGIRTEVVLPSLLTGVPMNAIKVTADGRLVAIRNSRMQKWQDFDQHATVFQDALDAGYRTAVAGWYNPYCRIFPEVLDRCFWTYELPSSLNMLPQQSILENALGPLLLGSIFRDSLAYQNFSIQKAAEILAGLHISDYRDLFAQADRLLRDPSLDFILIHMPIPHPGGIYSRESGTFVTSNSTYIDNLALADTYLAHVRSLLESQGQWDSAAVVVMGDHSWRTKLIWAKEPEWTQEEQSASHGGSFDDRPAYIVKLPNERKGSKIDPPFKAVDTRMLFDAIMSKDISTSGELALWVAGSH